VTDPNVQPADVAGPPADPDRLPADPDSTAGTDRGTAAHPAPSDVALRAESAEATAPIRPNEATAASGAMPVEDSPNAATRTLLSEAATRAMPTDEVPEPDSSGQPSSGQPPLGDSLQAQVARLDELDELPVAEHIERYEAVHNELQAALRGIHDPGG